MLLINNSLRNIRKLNNINKILIIIIIKIPILLGCYNTNTIRNIHTRILSTSSNQQYSISAVAHETNIPSTIITIISTIISSATDNVEVLGWEHFSQVNISSISTICCIMNNNSPSSNIINEILILIRSDIHRHINERQYIHSIIIIIIIRIPISLLNINMNSIRNITSNNSTGIDYQCKISAVSHVTNSPDMSLIIIESALRNGTINELQLISWEEISHTDKSRISTITSIGYSNSPNNNIMIIIPILISSLIHRQINVRLSFNSTIYFLFSAVRTSKSCIIGQITDSIDCNPKPNHSRSARSNIG